MKKVLFALAVVVTFGVGCSKELLTPKESKMVDPAKKYSYREYYSIDVDRYFGTFQVCLTLKRDYGDDSWMNWGSSPYCQTIASKEKDNIGEISKRMVREWEAKRAEEARDRAELEELTRQANEAINSSSTQQ